MKSSPQTFQHAALAFQDAAPGELSSSGPASPGGSGSTAWIECIEQLRTVGFDLVQPFQLGTTASPRSGLWEEPWTEALLPAWARMEPVLGILIGNSRQLWDRFLNAVQASPELERHAHPLDTYTVAQVEAALRLLQEGDPALQLWTGYSHIVHPSALPMTRLADWCGLGHLSPGGLVVHPQYGPWIALRSLVLVRSEQGLSASLAGAHPCQGCPAPCALQARRARGLAAIRPARDLPLGPVLPQLSQRARQWLAVRDVCPVGAAHRYSPAQISYHYDKDRSQLVRR